jgi:hypothetical protein
MKVHYRRAMNSEVWHFCESCSGWPAQRFKTLEERPLTGTLCSQCQEILLNQKSEFLPS